MSSCGCGSGCSCGSGCNCKNPVLGLSEKTTSKTIVADVAPVKSHPEGSEMSVEGGHGCKCGSSCNCDPCNC
uniref:Metallothionein-like protein 1 n=1 Tax=Casuarina glauca TaxID=3522 RepID=MT1_CASGL|nr:RecName: Full=Metallothionein-like protein 1; Short=MT-1 [Casuarina glauca]CAA65338.1 metallothionein [Casuarina glauca]